MASPTRNRRQPAGGPPASSRPNMGLYGADGDNDGDTRIIPPPQYRDLSPAPPFYSARLGPDDDPIIHFDLVRFSRDWNFTTGHFGEWVCSAHLVWAMCAILADNGTDPEWTEIFGRSRPQWDQILDDLRLMSEQQLVNPNARIDLDIPPAPIARLTIRQVNPPFNTWTTHGRRFRFTDEEGFGLHNMEQSFVLFRRFLTGLCWPNNEHFHITLMDTTWFGIAIE